MKREYVPPAYNSTAFNCPHCHAYAHQTWSEIVHWISRSHQTESKNLRASLCSHCKKWSYWYEQKIVVPSEISVEPRHPDLPEQCITEYDEAREIFAQSPRASAALLRLCIQKLMSALGQKGRDINDDIAALVKNGLSPRIQKALDICRVVGNNAVHPGKIDLNDTPDTAQSLFRMVNLIVEDRITHPKEIVELYGNLPEEQLKAVKDRDKDGD